MNIKYRSGYKYQLAEDYTGLLLVRPRDLIETEYITLSVRGRLDIRSGYAWDGPSGPTIDTPNFMRGSLVHDSLYQLIRMELLSPGWRVMADQELERICREDGMSWIRGWWIYLGVRIGAGYAADPKRRNEIIVAP